MKFAHGHNPNSRHLGEAHPLAKLTHHKVECMRVMRLGGDSLREIARVFKVSIGTASKAINGQTWRHVK